MLPYVPSSHETFGDSSPSFRKPLAPTTTTKTLPDFLRPFLRSVSPSVPFRKTVAFRSDRPTNQPTSPHNNDDGGGIPTNWHRTPLSWGSISPHSSPSLRAATCVASPPPSLPGFYYIGLICLRIHVRNFLRPLSLTPPSGGGCGAIRDSRSADASKKSPTKIEPETHLRQKSPYFTSRHGWCFNSFPPSAISRLRATYDTSISQIEIYASSSSAPSSIPHPQRRAHRRPSPPSSSLVPNPIPFLSSRRRWRRRRDEFLSPPISLRLSHTPKKSPTPATEASGRRHRIGQRGGASPTCQSTSEENRDAKHSWSPSPFYYKHNAHHEFDLKPQNNYDEHSM